MNNLKDYSACDSVAAVGGSFMAPAAMILDHDWAGITALCKKAVAVSLGFHLAHIGINNSNAKAAAETAEHFAEIFNIPYKTGDRSDFAGTLIESCKTKFPGTQGHIAIGTLSADRAAAYLSRKGIVLREEFAKRDLYGNLIAAYLQEEIAGFAIHLLKTS
jgi:2-dehydro-3-deoxyphosphogluconate aldolase/(4S)-4-hydroxy-2-oxoglutarate aldolase